MNENTKFCKHCGGIIPEDAVVCTLCGRQVEQMGNSASQPNIVINNSTTNANFNEASSYAGGGMAYGTPKSRMVSIVLCCLGFLGLGGLHKFYEGKTAMGVVYLFTAGLCFIGTIIDLLAYLKMPDTYYV